MTIADVVDAGRAVARQFNDHQGWLGRQAELACYEDTVTDSVVFELTYGPNRVLVGRHYVSVFQLASLSEAACAGFLADSDDDFIVRGMAEVRRIEAVTARLEGPKPENPWKAIGSEGRFHRQFAEGKFLT